MKTTADIPETELPEAIRRRRLQKLVEKFGTLDDFMTQEELRNLRGETILDLQGSVQPKSRPEDFDSIRRQVVATRGRMRAKPKA